MTKITALLFDVIGTTVLEDDPELINSSFTKAFQQHSIQIDKASVHAVRGKDKREAINEILTSAGKGLELKEEIFVAFEQNVINHLSGFREHAEFSNLVSFLRDRKIAIGVGSGLPQSIFEKLFDHLAWRKHSFDYVSTFERFQRGRPHPEMIYDMCEKCEIDKDEFLKVGDTVSDIEEGKNAGVRTAVILSGTQRRELLTAAAPTFIMNSLEDIKRLFTSGH
jgi:phosphonoacetaldehyde hydrolase